MLGRVRNEEWNEWSLVVQVGGVGLIDQILIFNKGLNGIN